MAVKCCDRDTDADGDCPIHSAPGVFRHRQFNAAPSRSFLGILQARAWTRTMGCALGLLEVLAWLCVLAWLLGHLR